MGPGRLVGHGIPTLLIVIKFSTLYKDRLSSALQQKSREKVVIQIWKKLRLSRDNQCKKSRDSRALPIT